MYFIGSYKLKHYIFVDFIEKNKSLLEENYPHWKNWRRKQDWYEDDLYTEEDKIKLLNLYIKMMNLILFGFMIFLCLNGMN